MALRGSLWHSAALYGTRATSGETKGEGDRVGSAVSATASLGLGLTICRATKPGAAR